MTLEAGLEPIIAAALQPSEYAQSINSPSNSLNNTADAYTCTLKVIKRNGSVVNYNAGKIALAISKAFLADEGEEANDSSRVHKIVDGLTQQVISAFKRRLPEGGTVHIEDIQDQVELALMRSEFHRVARAYVLYREEHKQKRAQQSSVQTAEDEQLKTLSVEGRAGNTYLRSITDILQQLEEAATGLEAVSSDRVFSAVQRHLFNGISEKDLATVLVMGARGLIEKDPNYSYMAARLLADSLKREVQGFLYALPGSFFRTETLNYGDCFVKGISRGVELELLDAELLSFDLVLLGEALLPDRDQLFSYLGLQTLYDRYFLHHQETRIELPQTFFMRVAMGLAINEVDREIHAIEFYQLLSSFDFMCSTPTLFNSGTRRPQLSSCYLSTIPDDLKGIFSAISDDAMLSKYAGGLGNDWTSVRAMGTHIKGTNGISQGVVPFLKVANDTAVAVNQGGKRKGAMCAYLETWHLDIEEFLELRKNTGDERRRTHDMNTANWIPDLFMERVVKEGDWTLFSPNEVPDLHDSVGEEFCQRYQSYEEKAANGEIVNFKTLKAVELWRKMLGMLFETGHPWITFKDPCNLRSPQQHIGVVHSSNLCTEIMLNTSDDEIAVCNLGSVNLAQHLNADGLDQQKLEQTVSTAMRMLDNVVDYNYYAVPQARRSNLRHRPVGLGLMGFQDSLNILKISYASEAALAFADRSMEAISYYAIQASSNLAKERGSYSSYSGSLWSQGVLPIDSIQRLKQSRGSYFQLDESFTMDWQRLRRQVKEEGMRNSNTMAIAPTATIANICGVSQSIEPTYQNLFVKSNLSGEFTVLNVQLVKDLKALELWDEVMVNDLKYYDGSVQAIERIPQEIKNCYQTAFEIDPRWLVEAAARRQKWIDQGQSLNLYMSEASGKKLDSLYKLAWIRGLKTTYYLRSMGATGMEKNNEHSDDIQQMELGEQAVNENQPKHCSIIDPDCDACQ